MLNAEGEEPIPNLASLLPNLEALSIARVGKNYRGRLYRALKRQPTAKSHLLKEWIFPIR